MWRVSARSRCLTAMLLLATCVLAGCEASGRRMYQPNSPDRSVERLPLKVAVVELEDGTSEAGFSNGPTMWIPGVFSATIKRVFHPTHFGSCFASELKTSKLFEMVEYHPTWEKLASDYGSYDVIVTGRLRYDKAERTMFPYGVAPFGSLFVWMLGPPAANNSRQAAFELVAFYPRHPKRTVWTSTVAFQQSQYDGFYFGHGDTDASGIMVLSRGGRTRQPTDFCPTAELQPQFLAARKSLAASLKAPASTLSSPNHQASPVP